MKKIILAALLVSLVFATSAFAADNDQFSVNKGDFFIGGAIGLNYFASDLIYGGNLEFIVSDVVGIGKIGVGAIFRYWSWGGYLDYSYSYTYIGAQGNYHFDFGGKDLDLYAGITIGYGIFDSSWSAATIDSQLLWGMHVGARWHLSQLLSLTGRISTGGNDFGGLEIGVDFRL